MAVLDHDTTANRTRYIAAVARVYSLHPPVRVGFSVIKEPLGTPPGYAEAHFERMERDPDYCKRVRRDLQRFEELRSHITHVTKNRPNKKEQQHEHTH